MVTPVGFALADSVARVEPRPFMHHPHRFRIVGGIIWLAIVIYVLYLATRVVRAVEKLADRSQHPTP